MVRFVIDEEHLRRLSAAARHELLQLLGADLARAQAEFPDLEWDPDGDVSYPLSLQDARILIRGMKGSARETLRVFCRNFDGDVGRADIGELSEATGHRTYAKLGEEINNITQRLQRLTEHKDAWLFNWHPEDWEWNEKKKKYEKGEYFISGPAVRALRRAFGMDK